MNLRDTHSRHTGIYNKKVKINVLRAGEIKISIEFENLEKIYDYYLIKNKTYKLHAAF